MTGVRQEQWQELDISGLGEKTEKYCRPPPVPCQESSWNFTYLLAVFCVMFSVLERPPGVCDGSVKTELLQRDGVRLLPGVQQGGAQHQREGGEGVTGEHAGAAGQSWSERATPYLNWAVFISRVFAR